MSLNKTPTANRIHIALLGKANAGKSSVINALTQQETALVSDVKGTTTDPVYKAMELLPLGPVVFIDTAGLDDESELGTLRKNKSMDVLNKADIALIVIDSLIGLTEFDISLVQEIKKRKIPSVAVLNKIDKYPINNEILKTYKEKLGINVAAVSSITNKGIPNLKKIIIDTLPKDENRFKLVGDLIAPNDLVVLVVPIDASTPKGRLILPQQQTIRDILENDAVSIVTREYNLKQALNSLGKKPRIVITDSQAFSEVAKQTPENIPLTSFSILFARNKGDLAQLVRGAKAIEKLNDGDKILISEACTHHIQGDDIGRVKIPRWLTTKTGKKLDFEFANGVSFPTDLGKYSLIVHCAGCMLNRKAMMYRINQAVNAKVPIVNYGVLIAYVNGILKRAIDPFPSAKKAWDEN